MSLFCSKHWDSFSSSWEWITTLLWPSMSSRIFTHSNPTLHLVTFQSLPLFICASNWLYLSLCFMAVMYGLLFSQELCIFWSLTRECLYYRYLHDSFISSCSAQGTISERSSLIKLPEIGRSSPQTYQLCIPYPALLFLILTIWHTVLCLFCIFSFIV